PDMHPAGDVPRRIDQTPPTVCASDLDGNVPMTRRARTAERGMTLIEVMVAIAIVAILGTMIWTAFSQTATNRRIIESAQDRYHAAAIAMDRISRDLQSAF